MLIDARERGPFTCPFITGYIRAPLPLINRRDLRGCVRDGWEGLFVY